MSWLEKIFQEFSIAWLFLSGIIGGLTSLSLKFVFEEIIGYQLKRKREIKQAVRQYSAPLIRTGDSLERRINNLIRNIDKNWFKEGEYYRSSTLFTFGEFFAWVYILEQRVNYLQFTSSRQTKLFEDRLNGVFRAITSLSSYFREVPDSKQKSESNIPRLILRAIGEKMTKKNENELIPISYTEFIENYKIKPDEYSSIHELQKFLENVDPEQDSLKWDRLILLGGNLKKLIFFLEKRKKKMPSHLIANLELIKNEEVKNEYLKEK